MMDQDRHEQLGRVLSVGQLHGVRPLPPDGALRIHRRAMNAAIDRLGPNPDPRAALERILAVTRQQVQNTIALLSGGEIRDALRWMSVLEARYLLSDDDGRAEIGSGREGRYARAMRRIVELSVAHGAPGTGIGANRFAVLWVRVVLLESLLSDHERIRRHGDEAVLERDELGWIVAVGRDVREVQTQVDRDEAALGNGRHADFVERVFANDAVVAELSASSGFGWPDAAGVFQDAEQFAFGAGGIVGTPISEFRRLLEQRGIRGDAALAFEESLVLTARTEGLDASRLHLFRQPDTMALAPFVRLGDEILWAFSSLQPALCANAEYAVTGRHPRWKPLGRHAAALVNEQASQFEKRVASLLSKIPNVAVSTGLKKAIGTVPAPPREVDCPVLACGPRRPGRRGVEELSWSA